MLCGERGGGEGGWVEGLGGSGRVWEGLGGEGLGGEGGGRVRIPGSGIFLHGFSISSDELENSPGYSPS